MISGRSQRLGRVFLSLVLGSVLTIAVFRIQALLPLSVGILTLRPLAALAVVVGYRGGIAGVGGVALGYSSYVVYHQTLGPLLLLEGVGFVILGVGGATLVAERPVSLARSPPELRNGPRLRYALVALFGVCVSVSAVLAAAYEVLALADFYPFAATRVTELTVSMLLFAVPALVVTDRLVNRVLSDDFAAVADAAPSGHSDTVRPRLSRFLGLSLLWVLTGSTISMGYHVVEQIPIIAFYRRGLELLIPLTDPRLVGHGGRTLQIALGTVFLLLLATTLYRSRV